MNSLLSCALMISDISHSDPPLTHLSSLLITHWHGRLKETDFSHICSLHLATVSDLQHWLRWHCPNLAWRSSSIASLFVLLQTQNVLTNAHSESLLLGSMGDSLEANSHSEPGASCMFHLPCLKVFCWPACVNSRVRHVEIKVRCGDKYHQLIAGLFLSVWGQD